MRWMMKHFYDATNKLIQMSSQEATQAAIQHTFKAHHEEIQRRSEIMQQGLNDDKTFSKVSDSAQYTFKITDQKYIVFSLSQESFSPCPVDVSNPAVCLFGAFENRDEAVEYARDVVLKEHSNISIFVDEMHNWIVAAKCVENLSNEEYVTRHRSMLLQQHQKMLHANLKDFEENVKEQKTGTSHNKDNKDENDEKEKQNDTDDKHDTNKKGRSHKISSKLDVRGQKLAVVSIVKDTAAVPEFLIKVYALFEKEEEANTYIRNVCGDNVQDFDIDVVSTCEWLFPQTMTYTNANKEIFRSEELDNIMRTHKNQPNEVAKFQATLQ